MTTPNDRRKAPRPCITGADLYARLLDRRDLHEHEAAELNRSRMGRAADCHKASASAYEDAANELAAWLNVPQFPHPASLRVDGVADDLYELARMHTADAERWSRGDGVEDRIAHAISSSFAAAYRAAADKVRNAIANGDAVPSEVTA